MKLEKYELEIIAEHVGSAVLPERDERGNYVYVIGTKEVLFADTDWLTLRGAYVNWCDAHGLIPF